MFLPRPDENLDAKIKSVILILYRKMSVRLYESRSTDVEEIGLGGIRV